MAVLEYRGNPDVDRFDTVVIGKVFEQPFLTLRYLKAFGRA